MKFLEEIENSTTVDVVRWYCHLDVPMDDEYPDLLNEVRDEIFYSVTTPENTFVITTVNTATVFAIQLGREVETDSLEPDGYRFLANLLSEPYAEHQIIIRGERKPVTWHTDNGITADIVSDDVHYFVDGIEMYHEISVPNVSADDPFVHFFRITSAKYSDVRDFLIEHPADTAEHVANRTSFSPEEAVGGKACFKLIGK